MTMTGCTDFSRKRSKSPLPGDARSSKHGAVKTRIWSARMLTVLIASAFVTDRVPESVPAGAGTAEATRAWLSGEGSPVWGLLWLAVMPVVPERKSVYRIRSMSSRKLQCAGLHDGLTLGARSRMITNS